MTNETTKRSSRRQDRHNENKNNKKPVLNILKKLVLIVAALGVAGLLFGGILFAYYASSTPKLDEESLKDPISTEFYDKNGELFASIGKENREYVPYEKIPSIVEDAILATEDVRFYKHNGIDFFRLGGAVLANITNGFGSQGASTLTQQVIKNSFLKNEKTLKRKAQEAVLAYKLEQKYEKEEIFEMYFNKILMSGNIYGVGTASKYFYGKELSELTLAEAALLAGMPQSPNRFNPYKNPEGAENRRNIVLKLMAQHGKITDAERDEAMLVPITEGLVDPTARTSTASQYSAYLDVVLDELKEKGDGAELSDGLKVYTNLDPNAQTAVENALRSDNFPTSEMQAGLTVVDTKTGAILAIGGGRDYGTDRGLNFAVDLKERGVGSTIKPILDYGPAIEFNDWSTGQTLDDEEITYTGTDQQIYNFDNKYLGKMTMREALYRSRNVPAVKAFREVSNRKRVSFATGLGLPESDYMSYESGAIGATTGINTVRLAAAYATFGNEGIYSEPYAIKSIEFRDGTTSKEFKSKSQPAMKEYTAYMITDMLRDVIYGPSGASGRTAGVSGLDLAGKTGTTNYSDEDMDKFNIPDGYAPDVWFAGYSTNFSIAVWTGYSDYKQGLNKNDSAEATFAQSIFRDVMAEMSSSVETENFKKPSSVVEAEIEVGTEPLKLASEFTPDELKQTELFVRGTEPTEVSEEYEALEVSAVTNLSVEYDDITESATLKWDHIAPEKKQPKKEDDKEESTPLPVTFEVYVSIDGEAQTLVTTTDKLGVVVNGILPGSSYTFTIIAKAEDAESTPESISLQIDADEPTVPETPITDENNGNGNGNDNNNEQPTDTTPEQPSSN